MNQGNEKIEKAVNGLKAAFLDEVYRGQGMSSFISGKIDTFPEDQRSLLTSLVTEQAQKAERVLENLDGLVVSVSDLNIINEKISAITNGSGISVSENVSEGQLELPGVISKESSEMDSAVAEVSVNESSQLEIPGINQATETVSEPVVEENVVANGVVEIPGVAVAEENAVVEEAVQAVDIPAVDVSASTVEVPTAEVPVVETAAVAEQAVAAPVAEVPVPAATVPAVETSAVAEQAVAAPVAEVPAPSAEVPAVETAAVAEQTVAAPVVDATTSAPLNETVTVAGTTGAIDDGSDTIVPFALSPIDEGITPATEAPVAEVTATTNASPEAVAAAIIPDAPADTVTSVAPIAPAAENIIQFRRLDSTAPKAILVTGQQCTNLVASRETNKVLAFPTGSSVSTIDPRKQMEDMLNQANALYQQGKTAEAQAIYNQVSAMNQAMQTSAPTDASALIDASAMNVGEAAPTNTASDVNVLVKAA